MATAATNYTWSFTPVVSAFPPSIYPNVALWDAKNGVDLQYQIQLSWPLEWPSRGEANGTALTMYFKIRRLSEAARANGHLELI